MNYAPPAKPVMLYAPGSPMEAVEKQAAHYAKFNKHPVLICGETGAGKEGIAHLLHLNSDLKGPFIPVNCATLANGASGSELFGHKKGAFTGAHSHHNGLFGAVENGTLFLDEITEIPMDMQAQLLRALGNGEIRRVGDTAIHHANVRIIAATNRDPLTAIREGKLREDLYYRLKGAMQITVPPLRARKMDIPVLARHFASSIIESYPPGFCHVPEITTDAISKLMGHDWPGNVRELQGVINNAAIDAQNVSPGEPVIITPELLKMGSEKGFVERLASQQATTRDPKDIKADLKQLFTKAMGGVLSTTKLESESQVARPTLWRFFSPDCNQAVGMHVRGKLTDYLKADLHRAELVAEFHVLLDELRSALDKTGAERT